MWKTMAKEERRVKELMDGAKRRAQRRKAFYDSKLGDPMQLLRVSGSSIRLVTNPETYAHNEDPKSLMPWASDPAIKIDRFDGRALLDYLPSTTPAMIESGLQLERDEDGIGNELRFERWHDLADKYRLRVSEEQCLAENEEEWNDLVARHHALIGKVSEKRRDGSDAATPAHQFGFNYGTESIEQEQEVGQLVDRDLTSLEEENILDHLDNLSTRDRDILDSMGAEFYIKDYYRLLRRAKADEDTRVNQLKMTAVNLERTLAGKKPLKPSEIEGLNNRCGRRNGQDRRVHNRHRGRSASPAHRSTRRSSPSYAPYEESSSRSGSESPLMDKVEFIVEFQSNTSGKGHDDEPEMDHHSISAGMKLDDAAPSGSSVEAWDKATKKHPTVQHRDVSRTSKDLGTHGSSSLKMSLAEKLKQRMRQGLDQSVRSNEIKRRTKERDQEMAQARLKGDIPSIADPLDDIELMRDKDGPRPAKGVQDSSKSAARQGRDTNRHKDRSRVRSTSRSTSRSRGHCRSRSKSRSRSRSRSLSRSRNVRRRSHMRSRRSRSREGRHAQGRSISPRDGSIAIEGTERGEGRVARERSRSPYRPGDHKRYKSTSGSHPSRGGRHRSRSRSRSMDRSGARLRYRSRSRSASRSRHGTKSSYRS